MGDTNESRERERIWCRATSCHCSGKEVIYGQIRPMRSSRRLFRSMQLTNACLTIQGQPVLGACSELPPFTDVQTLAKPVGFKDTLIQAGGGVYEDTMKSLDSLGYAWASNESSLSCCCCENYNIHNLVWVDTNLA